MARPTKRKRRTQDQLAEIDHKIIQVVADDSPVSLRGVFYRVVSLGGIEKTELGYRVIMRRLVELRRSGDVAYYDITDGTRWVTQPDTYNDAADAARATARAYRKNLWLSQDDVVHILSEKDAISGVILPVTDEWDVALGITRGYSSETFAYAEAQSIMRAQRAGKWVYVYDLGDHDPSGVDAWRDFERKVTAFLEGKPRGYRVSFERLAVNPEQIEEMGLPTRPTKGTDSRSAGFGEGGSVEVDAIPAPDLRQIVTDAIEQHVDQAELERQKAQEARERIDLLDMAAQLGNETVEVKIIRYHDVMGWSAAYIAEQLGVSVYKVRKTIKER
jgi:hypothetical protein